MRIPLLYGALLTSTLWLSSFTPSRAQAPEALPPERQRAVDSLRHLLAAPLPDSQRIGAHYELGLLWRHHAPDSALRHVETSAALAQKARRTRQLANAYNLLGALAKDKGDFPAALRQQLAALRLHEQLGNLAGQCITHNDLGVLYKNLKQWPAARQHYQQSLDLAEQMVTRPGRDQKRFAGAIAYTLNNLGTVAFEQGQYTVARPYYDRALAQARRIGNIDAEATALGNLGALEAETKNFAAATRYFQQALAIDERTDNLYGVTADLTTIGELQIDQKQFAEAERSLNRALATARRMQSGTMEREALQRFPKLYEAMGDARRTYEAHRRYIALSDSIFSNESAQQLAELRTQYETDKKEQQNRVLALQLTQEKLITRKRNIQLAVALLGLLGAGLITWLLMARARLRRRLEVAHERETQQHARAAAVIEAEERERRRIGADLHDGVGQLLSAAKLNLSGLQHELQLTDQGHESLLVNALDTLDESLREVRSLSHQLVPNALLRRGLVAAVREFIEKLGGSKLRVELDVLGLDQRLPPVVENVVYRAIQEVVSNIVRHSRADLITVQLLGQGTELTVLIEDNGIGFDVEAALARADSGIGLRNLFSRLEYLGGRLDIDSRPGRGTIVTMEVPLGAEVEPAGAGVPA